jgi:PadR family transcriptional regulator
MASALGRLVKKKTAPISILQGTLDLMILRTLATLGPRHAYAVAARLEQVSGELLKVNQGTLYPALVRLEQNGWIKGTWGKTETNRDAKYYAITKSGLNAMKEETQRWRQVTGVMDSLLAEES